MADSTRRKSTAKRQSAAKKPAPRKPQPQRAAVPRTARKRAAPTAARQNPPLPVDLIEHFGGQERIDLIVAERVPDDASAGDVLRLLLEARRLQVDPLRGDVYLARDRSRDGAGTTYAVAAKRDALLAYARRQMMFVGHDEAAIYAEDRFERGKPDAEGRTLAERAGIAHTSGMPGKRGALVGAWCAAEMRGEPPVVRVLDAAQYVGTEDERNQLDPDDPKRLFPDACMIAAAMCNALRIAAGLNDVVGSEELTRRPEPLPQLGGRAALPIFAEGPVDELDARILDAYQQAQALDALLWPPAKVRGRLASAKATADKDGGDPAVLDRLRDELASEIERDVAAEVARRHDPVVAARRLGELHAFDPTDLDEDARREYDTERAALEAIVAAHVAQGTASAA